MPVLNKYKDVLPPDAIYIGRGSRWGNPFVIGKHGTRDEVCDAYEQMLWAEMESGRTQLEQVAALHGKSLVCFCKPQRCHGDTLVKAALWALKELGREPVVPVSVPTAKPTRIKFTLIR